MRRLSTIPVLALLIGASVTIGSSQDPAMPPPAAGTGPASPAAPAAAGEVEVELTRISEEIIEAIRAGDKAGLDRHLAPEMILINRDGKEYSRGDLLDELVPPREGYDLRFKILDRRLLHYGDAALFTFLLDEYLTIFGHDVSTVYRNHFLFRRAGDGWKLALYTYWEKPSTPPVITPPQGSLDPLVGTYELAPGKWVTRITREGNVLKLQRDGGAVRDLLPMAGDRFYVPGVEAEYFFGRDATGKATTLVFRRNWIDLIYRRVD